MDENYLKLKSKTCRYYSIKNDQFNFGICQSWAYVHFLLGYIILFFFFYPRNYISFARQRISFPYQRKYFKSKTIAFETTVLQLLKDFLSCQFNIKSFNSERNRLTVNSLFLECILLYIF